MSAPLTEFTLETVLRDGLNELRVNPDRLDDLFSKFTQTHFNNQYGQDQIDEVKTWILNNTIRIVHAKAQIPTQAPCISIQMLQTNEEERNQQFSDGDGYEERDDPKTPDIIVPVVTPGTYDTLTGKLTVTNAADLSTICPGLVFVDNSGTKFTIKPGNSNLSGNKFINIGAGQTPDLGGDGRIESSIDFTRTTRRLVRLTETLAIGCHAKNRVHEAKYLFVVVYYILKSRSDSLVTRGIELNKGNTSIFDREDGFENELLYSRYIQMQCITYFDWDQEEVQVFDCFDATVSAEDEDGNKFNTNTSEDC